MKLQEHNAQQIRDLANAADFESELTRHSKLTSTPKYGWPGEGHEIFVGRLRELATRVVAGEEITGIPDIDEDDLALSLELRAHDDLCKYCHSFMSGEDCRILFVS